jgi:hypothetical protein
MNSKTVHDIYLEARAMQREGMSARKIAIRMGTVGAENGACPDQDYWRRRPDRSALRAHRRDYLVRWV